MNITVLDFMNYLASRGKPVSGLAMIALQNGWTGRTIIMTEETHKDDELYQMIKLEKYRWRHTRKKRLNFAMGRIVDLE